MFRKFPRDQWLKLFAAANKAAQPVRSPEEALTDEILTQEGVIAEVEDSRFGTTRQVGIVYRLSATAAGIQGPAPAVGQHTSEVLSELRPTNGTRAANSLPDRAATGGSALQGIKVVDLGLAIAGPYGPQMLGDLGASVIKVSRFGSREEPLHQHHHIGSQRGPRSIALNLGDPRGLEIDRRLAAEADVVHHNMRTGVAERLGIGYETLRRSNPRLIYCHLRGFERDGPRTYLLGNDQCGNALGGSEYEGGATHAGMPPIWHPISVGDLGTGVLSAAAVIQALYHRETTGVGQLVDTSILNLTMLANSYAFLTGDGEGVDRPRLDAKQLGLSPFYRLYQTADGWICTAVMSNRHWRALCQVMRHPDFDPDMEWRTRHDLGKVLEDVFLTKSARAWLDELDRQGVPCEISSDAFAREHFDEPDFIEKQYVVAYEHPVLRKLEQFGRLIDFSETPGRIAGPPPIVGQHTREILDELGYDGSSIDALEADGVVKSADVEPLAQIAKYERFSY